MIEEKKLVFDAEYEEKPLEVEKPKPIVETKTLPKPKPKPPVVEKVSKVDLKKTIEKCDKLFTLVFTLSGGGRWDEARRTLSSIKKDIQNKIDE